MSDYYLGVTFKYLAKVWNGCIPIRSKYQGIDVPLTAEDVKSWVLECYNELDPGRNGVWHCSKCGPVPQSNPQPAARIKALKQMGYFIATVKMDCATCGLSWDYSQETGAKGIY